ncbi:MAG TPA: Nif3-like dinuclear metal center hexameric protein, partial [Synergistaceae bacterium]|nr:Nif3-like dinuclear metal center hexameric protein [Synergistaceae bacterium]
GDMKTTVSTLALCGGSGGTFLPEAFACGAEAYFTADMKYHERLDALDKGVSLFIADHGEMERFSLTALAETVSKATGEKAKILDVSQPAFCMI